MSTSGKTLWFISGLLIGLIVGIGGVVIWNYSLSRQNMKDADQLTGSVNKQNSSYSKKEEKNKNNLKQEVYIEDTIQEKKKSSEGLSQQHISGKSLRKEDTVLGSTTTSIGQQSDREIFLIRKDELLGVRNIEIVNLQYDSSDRMRDSILAVVSGIKESKKDNYMSAEFWQSPVNYKGYKMSKTKIVLYGMSPDEDVTLYLLDADFFMKENQVVFKLTYTDEYRQLEKINDPLVLSKLSK